MSHRLTLVTINTERGEDDYVLHTGVKMEEIIHEVAKLEPEWTSFVLAVVRAR